MPATNRGTKLHCPHCGANFYDLDRQPAVCPKCQNQYVAPSPRLPSARGGRAVAAAAALAAVPLPDQAEDNRFEEDEALEGDEAEPEDEEEEDGAEPD